MLNYEQLSMAEGGPWIGSLAMPKLPSGRFIPVQDILARIPRGKDIENIALTGGEPLRHPDLKEIVEGVVSAGYRRILVRTDGRRLEDLPFLDALIKTGVNHFEVAPGVEAGGLQRLSRRAAMKQYKGMRNLRRIAEPDERLKDLYLAAVVPVCRDSYKHIIDFLDGLFYTLEVDRVIFCWGEPQFPIWEAGDTLERAIEFCNSHHIWAVTRGIPHCVVPGRPYHMEELFSRGRNEHRLPVSQMCSGCSFTRICAEMPRIAAEYAWSPRPIEQNKYAPFINDIVSKGSVFDESNEHLYHPHEPQN